MYRFIKSLKFALEGVKISLKERNMKIHVCFAIIAISLGFILHISATEWCIILLCNACVLVLEIVNTAFEHIVDLLLPNFHEKAAKIKDLSAAAVLVFSVFSLIIGLIIFVKPILNFF